MSHACTVTESMQELHAHFCPEKNKFALVSNYNRSLLRRQPGAPLLLHMCQVQHNRALHHLVLLFTSQYASRHAALLSNLAKGGMTGFILSHYVTLAIQRAAMTVDCALRMLTHRALSYFEADSNWTCCYMLSQNSDAYTYPALETMPGHCTCSKIEQWDDDSMYMMYVAFP